MSLTNLGFQIKSKKTFAFVRKTSCQFSCNRMPVREQQIYRCLMLFFLVITQLDFISSQKIYIFVLEFYFYLFDHMCNKKQMWHHSVYRRFYPVGQASCSTQIKGWLPWTASKAFVYSIYGRETRRGILVKRTSHCSILSASLYK